MPRKRKIVSHSVASLPTVPEIGVEVEIGSSFTPDLNSNPGPCRPRRKASTPHPGLGRFLYAHLFLFLFLFWGIFIDRRKKIGICFQLLNMLPSLCTRLMMMISLNVVENMSVKKRWKRLELLPKNFLLVIQGFICGFFVETWLLVMVLTKFGFIFRLFQIF